MHSTPDMWEELRIAQKSSADDIVTRAVKLNSKRSFSEMALKLVATRGPEVYFIAFVFFEDCEPS
jgi:hypothetical protein